MMQFYISSLPVGGHGWIFLGSQNRCSSCFIWKLHHNNHNLQSKHHVVNTTCDHELHEGRKLSTKQGRVLVDVYSIRSVWNQKSRPLLEVGLVQTWEQKREKQHVVVLVGSAGSIYGGDVTRGADLSRCGSQCALNEQQETQHSYPQSLISQLHPLSLISRVWGLHMFSNTSAAVGRGWQARSKGSLQQMIPSDEPAPHQSSCAHTSCNAQRKMKPRAGQMSACFSFFLQSRIQIRRNQWVKSD